MRAPGATPWYSQGVRGATQDETANRRISNKEPQNGEVKERERCMNDNRKYPARFRFTKILLVAMLPVVIWCGYSLMHPAGDPMRIREHPRLLDPSPYESASCTIVQIACLVSCILLGMLGVTWIWKLLFGVLFACYAFFAFMHVGMPHPLIIPILAAVFWLISDVTQLVASKIKPRESAPK
jgi:hypothetical protein